MSRKLHDLSTEELGKLFPVSLRPYDPLWPQLFEQEKINLFRILGRKTALSITHIGSTAIPGIAAKPCIDILLDIPENKQIQPQIIKQMKESGYDYFLQNKFPPPYLCFVKGYSDSGYTGQSYHIHAAPKSHTDLQTRPFFRDYLVQHPKAARAYEALKYELAEKHRFNREEYTQAKTEFIQGINEKIKSEQAGN